MLIIGSRIFPYSLPLKAVWNDAQGGFAQRNGVLLCLEADNGLSGWGDCAPLREDGSTGQLERWHKELAGVSWHEAQEKLLRAGLSSSVRCAVDTALADLAAQDVGLPLARWLNPAAELDVLCNASLGVLNRHSTERAVSAVRDGFAVLKLKIGLAGVDTELALLQELAAAMPTGIMLRLDANRAWGDGDARCFLAGLEGLPIELLEEPLAKPDLARLANLQQQTTIPLALDESLPELGLGQGKPVAAVVLKPMRLGGVQASLVWAKRAQDMGMRCFATSTVDSAVGVLAAAHLGAALGNGMCHGLDTSRWLERDVGHTPKIRAGRMCLEMKPGLNFEADWKVLSE